MSTTAFVLAGLFSTALSAGLGMLVFDKPLSVVLPPAAVGATLGLILFCRKKP